MSETEYLKCACKECGNNIEYPAAVARDTIACPHCGEWTELPAPGGEAGEEPVARSVAGVVIPVLLTLAVLVGGVGFLFYFTKEPDHSPKAPVIAQVSQPAAKPPAVPLSVAVVSHAEPVAESTNPPAPAEKRPKAASDLVVSRISLEKTKGTGLVHAVGTIRNNSEYERFRVKITVDLINKQGSKIGSTTDQKSVIEPHEKWKFHALVADRQADSAVLASVSEEQ